MIVLLLRLDAPMMSFGAPIVDNLGVIQPFPALSMLAGLLGNALGYDHSEADRLQALQNRIQYASRCDRPGRLLTDFQTVDLGQDFMEDRATAWTTRGYVQKRAGGEARKGTHIRLRDYHADSIHTVALSLKEPSQPPDVHALAKALENPERPLFLGRKCCLPGARILVSTREAPSPLAALCAFPRLPKSRTGLPSGSLLSAWWPDGETGDWVSDRSRLLAVTDERDWVNQIHGGSRLMRHGLIDPPEEGCHG